MCSVIDFYPVFDYTPKYNGVFIYSACQMFHSWPTSVKAKVIFNLGIVFFKN